MSQAYFYPPSGGSNASVGPNGAPIQSSSTLVAGESPTGTQLPLSVNASGDLIIDVLTPASVVTVVQPNGALLHVTVDASALPLGAATEAKQDTGNASLAAIDVSTVSIDTKTPAQGQALMAASVPVVIASDQSTLPISAASLPLPSGAATETTLAAIDTKTPAQGQALMAASVPVVIASDQSVLPVSAASLPLPSGAATAANQATEIASLASLDTKLPAQGQALMAASVPVTLASDQTTLPVSIASLPLPAGGATEATLAAISAQLPAVLGQTTAANSLSVTLASDQAALPVTAATPVALTITNAAITVGVTAVRLTVSGGAPAVTRVALVVTPDSLSGALFYIGSSSVTNSGATRGVQIAAGQTFIANNDAGDYWIVSSVAAQTVEVMEQA